MLAWGLVFSYKLRYIVGFWLVEIAISTNQKPTIYRNLYENTAQRLRIGRGYFAANVWPVFLILDMHVRNKKSWISSLYLAKLVNAQHKNEKTYAVLFYGHVYIIWSY